MVFWLISLVPELKLSSRRFGLSIAVIVAAFLAFLALVQADVPTDLEAVDEDAEVVETHSLASLKTDSRLDGKAALSFGYLTEQSEYAVMVRQSDGGYRKKRYPAEWSRYGKRAGYVRNREMHSYISAFADRGVIAFWDGASRGNRSELRPIERVR